MTSWGLILKNLFRRKLRTFLTIFAILVAFLIFGVLSAFQKTLTDPPQGQSATRLVSTNKVNFTQPLPLAYVQRVAALKNAEIVSHMSWFGGYYQESKNFIISFAVDPETYVAIYSEMVLTEAEKQDFLANRTGMLVGKKLADQYGWKVGDTVPLKSNIFRQKDGSDTWDFKVSGIFTNAEDESGDQFVVFHYDYFNESRSFGRDAIGQMIVKLRDTSQIDATAREIDELFVNSGAETETRTEAAFAQSFAAQLGDIGFIVTAVVGAAFITILLIAGNTMMLTVRERTGEIAVLKTIGFTARRIFAMILTESFILAFIGGLLGIALAYVALMALGSMSGGFMGAVKMTPSILITAFVLMALLGFVTGFLPAWRAMRTDIITAFARK
ncbi:MAG: FtsX-like permease family protein [Micropepsaceae bacterium]